MIEDYDILEEDTLESEGLRLEKKHKLNREQELADIKEILRRPEGVRFFRRMATLGCMCTTTFTGNSKSYFLEGHRNYFLTIFRDIAEVDRTKALDILVPKNEE